MSNRVCPNCDTPLTGPYCSQCGQPKIHAGDLSLAHAGHHVFHELLHLDGRLWGTVRLLLTRPGQLSLDFLEGRRQRHLHPVRVFLAAAALFFVFGNATVLRLEHVETRAPHTGRLLEQRAARAGLSKEAFQRSRNPVLQATFKLALLPGVLVTGLLQAGLFRQRFHQIGEHLTVAGHNQSAMFVLSLPLGWLAALSPHPSAPVALSAAVAAVYGYVACRRVYGGSRWGVAVKILCLAAVAALWSMLAMGVAFRRAIA